MGKKPFWERLNSAEAVRAWIAGTCNGRQMPAYMIALNGPLAAQEYTVYGPDGPVDGETAVLVLGEVLNSLKQSLRVGGKNRANHNRAN